MPSRTLPLPPDDIICFQKKKDSGLAQFGRHVFLLGEVRLKPKFKKDSRKLGVRRVELIPPSLRAPRGAQCKKVSAFVHARKAARFFDNAFGGESERDAYTSAPGSVNFFSPAMDRAFSSALE